MEKDMEKSQQFVDLNKEGLESANTNKRTIASIRTGEMLLEDIDLAYEESKSIEAHRANVKVYQNFVQQAGSKSIPTPAAFVPNPLLMGSSPAQYILNSIKRIQSSQLETALSFLNYSQSTFLLKTISNVLKGNEKCVSLLFSSSNSFLFFSRFRLIPFSSLPLPRTAIPYYRTSTSSLPQESPYFWFSSTQIRSSRILQSQRRCCSSARKSSRS